MYTLRREHHVAIRVALNHQTTYRYDRLVTLSPQTIRLRPAPHCRTPILSYSLTIRPSEHFINWQQDPQSNYLARVVFPEQTRQLSVEVDLVADMTVINPFDFFLDTSAEEYPFTYEPLLARELIPSLETEPAGPQLQAFVDSVSRDTLPTVDFLVHLNRRVQQEIQYLIRLQPGLQSCEETLTLRRGSCRDSAWLLVQILRHLGLAARFVSGYLIQLVADVKPLDGAAGPAEDSSDLHAWTEVYLPGAGWVGLDPTSGLLAGEGHIPLACTPHVSSAAPITGAVSKSSVDFQFALSVTRIHAEPRLRPPCMRRPSRLG
jgi:transglutaminase-like putative cysteine protease